MLCYKYITLNFRKQEFYVSMWQLFEKIF